MKKLKLVVNLVGIFITMPIWFYLLHAVLVRVNASELMWFLFWAYVPLAVFISVMTKIAESA